MSYAFAPYTAHAIEDIEDACNQFSDSDLRESKGIVIPIRFKNWSELVHADEEALRKLHFHSARARLRLKDHVQVIGIPHTPSLCAELATNKPLAPTDLAPRVLVHSAGLTAKLNVAPESAVSEICKFDLNNLLLSKADRVILSPGEGHFSVPSGAHVNRFVRVTEAITCISDLDRLSYWVAQRIRELCNNGLLDVTAVEIVVDTASLLSVALRVSNILGHPLRVHSLLNYPMGLSGRGEIEDLFDSISSRRGIPLFLISIAASGNLQTIICDVGSSFPSSAPLMLPIFSLPTYDGANALCAVDLPGYSAYRDSAECELCRTGSQNFRISPKSYFIHHDPAENITLSPGLFQPARDFIQLYGAEPGVLRVHYDDPNEQRRHHAFYVDVRTLLSVPTFRDNLKAYLSEQSKPDIVLSADHAAGRAIGEFVADYFGIPHVSHQTFTMSAEADGEAVAAIKRATSALVVDDVTITGSRLRRFNDSFRTQSGVYAGLTQLNYFAVLSLHDSDDAFIRQKRGLTTQHQGRRGTFSCMYEIRLPNWNEITCPWCVEYKALTRLAKREAQFDNPFAERLSELSDTESGLGVEWVFGSPTDRATKLGAHSAVLNEGSTSLQVLFSSAVGLQRARMEGQYLNGGPLTKLNPNGFPKSTRVMRAAICDYYNEKVLSSALLRVMHANELSEELRIYLRDEIENAECANSKPAFLRELGAAALTGKLGEFDAARLSNLLQR